MTYRPPQEGEENGVRCATTRASTKGGEISIYYDPMIAKLVTHAPTRLEAIEAQATALDAFAIDGIRHNIRSFRPDAAPALAVEPSLTGFIAEEFPQGFKAPAPEGIVAHRMAAVGAAVDHLLNERKHQISGQMRHASPKFERERVVMLGHEHHEVGGGHRRRHRDRHRRRVLAGGVVLAPGRGGLDRHRGRRDRRRAGQPILNGMVLSHAGTSAEVRVHPPGGRIGAHAREGRGRYGQQLLCPMPGLVKAISVRTGQEVKAGEPLCIDQAMKMENVLRAERDGTISKIHAKEGYSLALDATIMEFA